MMMVGDVGGKLRGSKEFYKYAVVEPKGTTMYDSLPDALEVLHSVWSYTDDVTSPERYYISLVKRMYTYTPGSSDRTVASKIYGIEDSIERGWFNE